MADKTYGEDCEACGGLDGDHMPGCKKAATAARRPSDAPPEGQPAPAGEQPREAE